MITFSFKARDGAGQHTSGLIEARNRAEALSQLQKQGLTVTDIGLGSAPIDPEEIRVQQAARTIGRDEVIAFASQLAVMLETGVPLGEALGAYVKESRTGALKKIMTIVSDRITSGLSFSAAIEEFPRVFPRMMITLMKASEASGTMALMLSRIAKYLDKERKTVKQIKGALTYPMIMVTVAIAVTLFLIVAVLPRFAKIYESRQAALPTPTRLVLQASDLLMAHWMMILVGAGIAIAAGWWIRSTTWGRRLIDWLKIHVPVIGPMFTQYYLTRAARTLSTLLASGVTLLDAVRIVRNVTSNLLWEDFWTEVEHSMTAGRTIADVVTESKLIPASVAQMIAAGERTGKLSEVLDRIATSSEDDLDQAIKNATQLIEPAMIIFMGLTIGGIAISLLLPIFTIANVMSK